MKLLLSGVPSAREENSLSVHSAVAEHLTPLTAGTFLPFALSLIAARLFFFLKMGVPMPGSLICSGPLQPKSCACKSTSIPPAAASGAARWGGGMLLSFTVPGSSNLNLGCS